MAISEQARRRNEFFDDILLFFEDELIKSGMNAEQSAKSAEEIALKLHERWQSHTLVFPKNPELVFKKQKQEVLAEFTGNNISFLVRKYRIAERTIYRWLREEIEAAKQKQKEQQGHLDL